MRGYVRRILMLDIGGSHSLVVDDVKDLKAWRNAMYHTQKYYGYNLTSEVSNRQLTIYRHKPEPTPSRLKHLIAKYPFHKMTNGQRIAKRFTDMTTANRVKNHCYEYARLSGYKFHCKLSAEGLLEIFKVPPYKEKVKGNHREIVWNRNLKDADYKLAYMRVGDSLSVQFTRYTMLRTMRHRFETLAKAKGWIFTYSTSQNMVLTIQRKPNDIILRRTEKNLSANCKYPFADMKVGDYVTFKTKSTHNARNAAYMIQKRNPGRKYKLQCFGDTVQAWRLS